MKFWQPVTQKKVDLKMPSPNVGATWADEKSHDVGPQTVSENVPKDPLVHVDETLNEAGKEAIDGVSEDHHVQSASKIPFDAPLPLMILPLIMLLLIFRPCYYKFRP